MENLLNIVSFSGPGSLKVFKVQETNDLIFEKGIGENKQQITILNQEFELILKLLNKE